jgi:hypothetical protein
VRIDLDIDKSVAIFGGSWGESIFFEDPIE